MNEGSVCDLSAAKHFECVDPAQVHEGHVRDGRLVTEVHIECV